MIRKAKIKDIPRIAEIIVFGKRSAYREIFHNDIVSFNQLQVVSLANEYYENSGLLDQMLVYDDGIVKGVINRIETGSSVEVCDFYVEPFFKGTGIGRQLLAALIGEARQQGCQKIFLWVIEKNQSARQFYERNGFLPTGKTAIIDGTSQIDLHYELSLST